MLLAKAYCAVRRLSAHRNSVYIAEQPETFMTCVMTSYLLAVYVSLCLFVSNRFALLKETIKEIQNKIFCISVDIRAVSIRKSYANSRPLFTHKSLQPASEWSDSNPSLFTLALCRSDCDARARERENETEQANEHKNKYERAQRMVARTPDARLPCS